MLNTEWFFKKDKTRICSVCSAPKAEEGKGSQQVYKASHLSGEKQHHPSPPTRQECYSFSDLFSHSTNIPRRPALCLALGRTLGGGGVSEMPEEAAKSTLSLRCPLGPGQRGPQCRAVVWWHILQLMGAIKYYETEKMQDGSGLYKDHSGRIMENRDTRSEDQGSGGLSNSPISMLSKISNVGLSKREQIHIYSEEKLRRNQKL